MLGNRAVAVLQDPICKAWDSTSRKICLNCKLSGQEKHPARICCQKPCVHSPFWVSCIDTASYTIRCCFIQSRCKALMLPTLQSCFPAHDELGLCRTGQGRALHCGIMQGTLWCCMDSITSASSGFGVPTQMSLPWQLDPSR